MQEPVETDSQGGRCTDAGTAHIVTRKADLVLQIGAEAGRPADRLTGGESPSCQACQQNDDSTAGNR
jgi:hypothetical protein